MSEWIGNKEVGLSPGQTGGEVNGVWVERPAESDPSTVYDPKKDVVVGKQQMGYQSKTKIAGAAERDSQIGERRVYISSQTNFPEASGAATPSRVPYYPSFTPYAPGISAGYGQKYPFTPIEKETPAGYGYATYPLYKEASKLSNWMQRGVEEHINVAPVPRPVKQVASGFYGFFTGLPEWGASGLVGWEGVARTKDKKELPRMFVSGAGLMASSIVTQAKMDPYRTAGFGLGMLVAPRVMEVPKVNIKIASGEMFGVKSSIKSIAPTPLTTLKITKASDITSKGIWTPITAESGALRYLASKTPTPKTYPISVSSVKPPVASKLSVSEKMFGKGTLQPLSNIKSNIIKTPSLLSSGFSGATTKMFGARGKAHLTELKITKPSDITSRGIWTPEIAERGALKYLSSKLKKPKSYPITVSSTKPASSGLSITEKMFGKGTLKPLSNIASNIRKTPSLLKSGIVAASKNISRKMFGTVKSKGTILKVTKSSDIEIVGKWTPAIAEKSALKYITKGKHQIKPQISVSSIKSPKISTTQKMFGSKEYRPARKPFVIRGLLYSPGRPVRLIRPAPKQVLVYETIKTVKPKPTTKKLPFYISFPSGVMGGKTTTGARLYHPRGTRFEVGTSSAIRFKENSIITHRSKPSTSITPIIESTSITTPKYRIVPETDYKPRQVTRLRTPTDFTPRVPKIPKLRSSSMFGSTIKKKTNRGLFGKFTELARVASPSRILTGSRTGLFSGRSRVFKTSAKKGKRRKRGKKR